MYNIKCKVYYNAKENLYFGIAQKDIERERVDKIMENLRKYGVDENIIKKVTEKSNPKYPLN